MSVTPQVIGIAVVEHAGAYLVGVRGPDGPLPGCAEFPGGKCHPDEAPGMCACRECLEETGLVVTPVECLLEHRHTYPHGTVELHFWLCRPVSVAEVRSDHQGFRWIAAAELGAQRFPEANAAVLGRLTGR